MNNQRHPALAAVRASLDKLDAECKRARNSWPLRYPVPPEVDALLEYRDMAINQARSGALRTMAEVCAR